MRPAMQNNMDKEEAPIEEDDNFPYPSLNWFLFIVSLLVLLVVVIEFKYY